IAASAEAASIDTLSNAHYWMISFLFSLIMVLMLYAVVVFKRQPGDEEDGPHIHGNTALEIGWTIVPLFAVVGFSIWGAAMLIDITRAEPGEMVVGVQGQQWSWSFTYPEHGDFSSAELVLPVNQPIVLEMETKDVIHNFWVVEFRVKQDLLPGSVQELRITPTEEGEYKVRCAEICGLSHSEMLAPVRVVSAQEFDAWVEEKNAAPKYAELTPEERGAIWHSAESGFAPACSGCHSLDGSPGAGPTWLGIFGREEALEDGTVVIVDEEYIRNSILKPNEQIVEGFPANVMSQEYENQFAEKQAEILANEGIEIDVIDDLIAFMKTLEE
ncbi:MAG: cytochrome c oxidase subunit II, partial [Candidatus Promineifilaceae bacterium]|nr:cytochrome c oxidase subunit II [Candidatus Promineifilaceae bacterium]